MAKEHMLRYSVPVTIRAKSDNTHEFVISDATLDRYRTVIPIDAWDLENYMKNPIVAYAHDTSGWSGPDSIIGKSDVWIEDDKLVGRVTYEPRELNELADKIRRKVDFGTLSATSVGFYPKKGHFGEERPSLGSALAGIESGQMATNHIPFPKRIAPGREYASHDSLAT